MGTQLNFSMAFHPQTNGKSERTIQTLEGMLRACSLDLAGSWECNLALIEFMYNNSYHASIEMAPYEALYGRKCRSPLCWIEVGENRIPGTDIVKETSEKIKIIKDKLITACSCKKSYDDHQRRDLEFDVGDQVLLKVSPLKAVLRFGRKES